MTEIDPQAIELLMTLRRKGIGNDRILSAMERTPRHLFLEDEAQALAYQDKMAEIGHGEKALSPAIVGLILEKLQLTDTMKALVIGMGTGCLTATLSRLVRRVYAIERRPDFVSRAERTFSGLGLTNIVAMTGDGAKGWPVQAPFDRIIVTAAFDDAPEHLFLQMRDGGRMIAPVDLGADGVMLMDYLRTGEEVREDVIAPIDLNPLGSGVTQ